MQRLVELIKSVNLVQKKRIPTKSTKGGVKRRLNSKKQQAKKKSMRAKVEND
ncbi:MAG: ribosome-associated protein [Sulfurimonas sp.]|jgi:ribosome-associated protein